MIRRAISVLPFFCAACGGGQDPNAPRPALAESRLAQGSFRALEARFYDETDERRAKLGPALTQFLIRYPQDARADEVRVLLAWVRILTADLVAAEALIRSARSSSSPSVRDLAEVATARLLLARGDAASALSRLGPLTGKLLDADQRWLFAELTLSCALANRRYDVALDALTSYLAAAPAELGEHVRARGNEAVTALPSRVLEASLSELDRRARLAPLPASEVWLRRAIRERLSRVAIEQRDATLARRLLDSHPGLARRYEVSQELLDLAGKSGVAARDQGAFVGLALEVGDAEAERRSASAARGLSVTLAAATGGAAVSLLVKAGTSNEVGAVLAGLRDAGALVLVAGMSAEGAEQAARAGSTEPLPLLLLRDPGVPSTGALVLGENPAAELLRLEAELTARQRPRFVRVGEGGFACDRAPERAGLSPFPLAAWKHDGIDALLVTGSAACAKELFVAADRAGFAPTFALSLESAEAIAVSPRDTFALRAGTFPAAAEPAAETEPPDFYEALGHDAGLLAREAIVLTLAGRTFAEVELASARRQVRAALTRAEADLWTSNAHGFGGADHLPRELEVTVRR